jgi:DUF4097 and DUF4098 domain-containing protein YvlB
MSTPPINTPPNLPPGPPTGTAPAQPPYPQGPPPRPVRRRSIFPGLLLILMGVIFLVGQLYPGFNLGYAITHFWPVVIILLGAAKLIDRFAAPREVEHPAVLTGGEIGLIVLMALLVGVVAIVGHIRGDFQSNGFDFGPFQQRVSETRQASVLKVNKPDSLYTIDTPRGAINIHAASDNSLNVVGTGTATAGSENVARGILHNLDVAFDGPDGNYHIHPVNANGGVSVDLDVALPKAATVVARTQRGDVTISDVQGSADASTRNGDLQIHDTGSTVTADIQNGDAHIRNVAGEVNLSGRGGGDVDIADVKGAVTLSGNPFGDIDVRNAPKGVHYSSSRSNLQLGGVSGELKMDTGDINLSRASGPVVINARNQDLSLDEVDGQIQISDNRGDIAVSFSKPPKSPINITDDSGDVTLTLPDNSAFTVSADSKSGNISSDFAPDSGSSGVISNHHLDATHGSGGPTIQISTKYGDIHINKSH